MAAAVIGGVINVATHWDSIDNVWQGLGYFAVGGAAGAIGAVTGGAFAGGGFIGGAIGGGRWWWDIRFRPWFRKYINGRRKYW